MHLEHLELQGFKSFAGKTLLEFPDPNKKVSITAVVGPNGSGKSCVADAIRWVLGEQSLKLLRAKKSTDVIFSGSQKKAQSGFAEVTIYLDNSDKKAHIDYSELAITRRLYKNGDNEYYINKGRAKLQDILMLLAQANFGQRTYSVIGQGMIDAVLAQSPKERKDFFDEAAGIKQFQIKKHSSINKLKSTETNINQVEILLAEIRPRLRTLSRQVDRLERHDEIKNRLHYLEHIFYGNAWHELKNNHEEQTKKISHLTLKLNTIKKQIEALQTNFESKESKKTSSDELLSLQGKYNELINKKNSLREKEFSTKEKIAQFKMKQSGNKQMAREAIVSELQFINSEYRKIINSINDKTNPLNLRSRLEAVLKNLDELNEKINNPENSIKIPEELQTLLSAIGKDIEKLNFEIKSIEGLLDNARNKQKSEQSQFFALQKDWRDKVEEKNILESQINELKIELARIETKKEGLETEMETHLKERKEKIIAEAPKEKLDTQNPEGEIQSLRYQMELIGGIDPETIKEYKETKERFEFLESQNHDLVETAIKLKDIIRNLEIEIKKYFEESFKNINRDFEKFFSFLFEGGKARLELIEIKESEEYAEEHQIEIKSHEKIEGIEIYATPPGKKVSSINMLSGGERALTSIALISAIISNNPSPFVVLDEVDAALDESNSIRFAEIIKKLGDKTQFVLITHNRATMATASILYGVSMNDDGASQLLSLKLEDAGKMVNR